MTKLSQTDAVFARLQKLCKEHGFERVEILVLADGLVGLTFHGRARVYVSADLLEGGSYDQPDKALRAAFPDWSNE